MAKAWTPTEEFHVTRTSVACYRIPLPTVLTDSTHGEMPDFELITVCIVDEDGIEGVGYTYTVGHGGLSVLTLLEHDVLPLLDGEDLSQIQNIWDKTWSHLHWIGRGGVLAFAMAAVDIALWDLKAKRENLPLWQLLRREFADTSFWGGTCVFRDDAKVKAYAGGIDLMLPLDDLLAQTQRNLDNGFRAIKMKVGRDDLNEDVERISAMRKFLGDGFPLMVDANMRWSVERAIDSAKAFADSGLVWLEEPIAPDDFAGHRKVLECGGIPISAGENLHTVMEFEHLLSAGGVSFAEPDVANIGGVTAWMQVASMAAKSGLPVTSHGVHDLHVHLLAASPNASFLEVHGFGLEPFLADPLRIVDGWATAPNRPGHGVEFDWSALNALSESMN